MAGETPISIVGNMTADPEVRQAGSAQVATFTVAVTARIRQGDEWVDGDATFFRCNAWRELGEHVAATFAKGMRVIVTGRLQQRNWEKDGQKRSSIEIEVDEAGPSLKYATARVERQQRSGTQNQRQAQAQQQGGPANVVRHSPPPSQQSWHPDAFDPNVPF